jgi:competence protein ComEA
MNKILLAVVGFFIAAGMAGAAVDLNSADEQALGALKGVGTVRARAIVDERKKNGPYKSIDDVSARVKGIGPATVAQWKKDGSASAAPMAPPAGATGIIQGIPGPGTKN